MTIFSTQIRKMWIVSFFPHHHSFVGLFLFAIILCESLFPIVPVCCLPRCWLWWYWLWTITANLDLETWALYLKNYMNQNDRHAWLHLLISKTISYYYCCLDYKTMSKKTYLILTNFWTGGFVTWKSKCYLQLN